MSEVNEAPATTSYLLRLCSQLFMGHSTILRRHHVKRTMHTIILLRVVNSGILFRSLFQSLTQYIPSSPIVKLPRLRLPDEKYHTAAHYPLFDHSPTTPHLPSLSQILKEGAPPNIHAHQILLACSLFDQLIYLPFHSQRNTITLQQTPHLPPDAI